MRVVAVERRLKGSRYASVRVLETCTYTALGSLNEGGCMVIAEGKKRRQRGISAPLHSPKGGLTLAAPFICSAAVRGEANTRRAVGPRGYVLWTTVQLLVLVKLLDKAQFNNNIFFK